MSPVYQQYAPGLGDALQQAFAGYASAKARRMTTDFQQRQIDAMDRAKQDQDIQDTQNGIHRLAPGQLPPSQVFDNITSAATRNLPAVPSTDGMMRAIADQFGTPGQSARPALPPGAENIPGHPAMRAQVAQQGAPAVAPSATPNAGSDFQSMLASSLSGQQPTRGPRYQFGNGFYIDNQPRFDAQDAARSQHLQDQFTPMMVSEFMKQSERGRKIKEYTDAGVPADRAALYVDNPSLADNDPKYGKPHTDVMGERTAKSVMVDGKPAEVMIDKAGNAFDATGKKVTGQIAPYVAPPNPETAALRDLTLSTRKDAMSQRNEARLVSQYTEATKKYSQTADALQAINENRAGALKGDPVAQQTLLQDFIKLNLPGQQVTEGDIGHYMNLMGLGEKGQQLLDKLRQGTPLGQEQIKLILSHADNLAVARRQAHQYLRQQYVDRGARSGVPAESFPDWFGFLPPSGPQQAPATPQTPSSGNTNLGDASANPFTKLIPKNP